MDLTKVDSIKKRTFLAVFSECGNVTKSAEIAGCARQTHYDSMANDPEYVLAFDQAKEAAADKLEQEARRRAVEGVAEPVFYQGKQIGTVQRYSDNLLMFLLKGERPEKFKDRQEVTGKNGGPIQLEAMTADQRQSRIIELLEKRDS
ncbi:MULTISPECIES: hypothetical protein [Pelosinus]|nr:MULTISPECIES: hypothetical protein [Pelosinus]